MQTKSHGVRGEFALFPHPQYAPTGRVSSPPSGHSSAHVLSKPDPRWALLSNLLFFCIVLFACQIRLGTHAVPLYQRGRYNGGIRCGHALAAIFCTAVSYVKWSVCSPTHCVDLVSLGRTNGLLNLLCGMGEPDDGTITVRIYICSSSATKSMTNSV